MSQVASAKADLKITIISSRGSKASELGHIINIGDLSPRALSMLSRINPRILTSEFYTLPLSERKVTIYPNSMMAAFDDKVSRATEPYAGAIVPPQISKNSPALQVGSYGSPYFQETFVRWLDGAAAAISKAVDEAKAFRTEVVRGIDRDLDVWLGSVVRAGARDIDAVIAFDHDNGKWNLKWDQLPVSKNPVMDEAMRMRLRDRAIEAGALSLREYMLSRPDTAHLAELADERVHGYNGAMEMQMQMA